MVEVFTTDIHNPERAQEVLLQLKSLWPAARIIFDLEDCDRILKIESPQIDSGKVVQLLSSLGYDCQILI